MELFRKSSIIVLGLLLVLLLLSFSLNIRFLFQSRASGVGSSVAFSIDNSYIFLSPLQALANNKDRIRITVFLLNSQGRGVTGKQVALNYTQELTVESVQATTDSYGRAVFDAYTSQKGDYYVEAMVSGTKATEGVRLKFN
jgi:hypothetical protein